MPDESKKYDQGAAVEGEASKRGLTASSATESRRVYSPPQLRRLGSVAELTFAGGSVSLDSGIHSTAKSKG